MKHLLLTISPILGAAATSSLSLLDTRKRLKNDWHNKHVDFWKSKLGASDYGMLWVAFVEGVFLGLLVYHYGITT